MNKKTPTLMMMTELETATAIYTLNLIKSFKIKQANEMSGGEIQIKSKTSHIVSNTRFKQSITYSN